MCIFLIRLFLCFVLDVQSQRQILSLKSKDIVKSRMSLGNTVTSQSGSVVFGAQFRYAWVQS